MSDRRVFNPKTISFSEASDLARCEELWRRRWLLDGGSEPTLAMRKGTLVHLLTAEWWDSGSTDRVVEMLKMATEHGEYPDDVIDDATWIMGRYIQHYGPVRDGWKIEAVEATPEAMIPGTRVKLTSHIDQLAYDSTGGLWVVERKTMKDWQRIEHLDTDWQSTLYFWLMRANGYPVEGVAYDAIRTYRWKRDEHPPSDSFQWHWLPRSDEQAHAAIVNLRKIVERRTELVRAHKAGEDKVIKNLNFMTCRGCQFKDDCYEDEKFPRFSIVWEDE